MGWANSSKGFQALSHRVRTTNVKSGIHTLQVAVKRKDFLKVTFCGQSEIIPGSHNDMEVQQSAGSEFQETGGIYIQYGTHTHSLTLGYLRSGGKPV